MFKAVPVDDAQTPDIYALAHAAWLPDAMRALAQLEFAVEHKNARDVRYFCDCLRRGAFLVRAKAYITVADDVEASYRRGDFAHCQDTIAVALTCSRGVAQLIERMKTNPERFDPRGIIVNNVA